MAEQSRHDTWSAGDHYDRYMGRWSRRIAPLFLEWVQAPPGQNWLEVGCGTGALTAAILDRCHPADLVGIDPSDGFLAQARANVPDPRASFQRADAQALPLADASRDIAVSGLVLNFVPDRPKALAEMRRVTRRGGRIAFYVWDYPGGGIAFMRAFWTAAVALDPAAADLTEARRFGFCTRQDLVQLAASCGLADVESTALETDTVFADFDDYWQPFTLGAGPAPGYCASLDSDARERLKEHLRASLTFGPDGSLHLTARAWGVKATAP